MNEQLVEEIKGNPQKFNQLSFGDMLDVVPAISMAIHDRLMDLAGANEEMKDLISAFSEVTFFQHQMNNCAISDVEEIQGIVNSLWGKKKSKRRGGRASR